MSTNIKSKCCEKITSRISFKKWLPLFYLFTLSTFSFSNNIAVSNITTTSQNNTLDFTLIEFDLSWDNSWRTSGVPNNWDAAWIFVKYRLKDETTWNHASLNWVDGTGSGDGHTVPANSNISSSNDSGSGNSYGVFLYRNADMAQGTVSYADIQLRWEYGDDGLQDNDRVEVVVYAVEMVYVPQGSFEVGSGGSETGAFYQYPTTTNTYTVSSEGAIVVGTSAGNLYYNLGIGLSGDQTGPIPVGFPKGYNAFYCMKYEISQGQYADFLSKLTFTQSNNRYPNQNGNFRHSISGSFGAYNASNPYIACNFMSWNDLAAYLDWSALRPMTELEYEKSCRGVSSAIANEFAWGTTNIINSNYSINNNGLSNESINSNYSVTSGNCIYGASMGVIDGPLRCGIFSANANNTGRITSGASYYGIMELTGNLWERPITLGNLTGRLFTNIHGNGLLDSSGNANSSTWPSTALGAGFQGGYWEDVNPNLCRVSNRRFATNSNTSRQRAYGGRGIRTAP